MSNVASPRSFVVHHHKQRRVRAMSVEGDLAELAALHGTLRDNRRAVADVVSAESHERNAIVDREDRARRRTMRDFETTRKDLVAARAKTEQRAKPPPMVAAMGQLFLKSRAQDRAVKAEKEQQRREAKQARIDAYKRRQRKLLNDIDAAKASEAEARHEFIAAERQRRKAALDFTRSEFNDQRSRSVLSMVEERHARRQRQHAHNQEWLSEQRRRITEERDSSYSPSNFLKLPPLFASRATVAPRSASDIPTDLVLLRQLREDAALASTPLPPDERELAVGDDPDAGDLIVA